jgi:hypothetical protein
VITRKMSGRETLIDPFISSPFSSTRASEILWFDDRDAGSPSVRAAWSAGAATGQRGAPVSAAPRPGVGVLLVVAGEIVGRADPPGRRRCICRSPRAVSGL